MQVAPPSILHPADAPVTPPSSQEKSFDDIPSSPTDVSRHLASLKTRLDFACFKLHHGWESSTLFDVEMMWKKKQRQMYSEIPRPRVTQQDILDKRAQVPSARTSKAKRARLTRTLSAPSPPPAHHTYKKRKSQQLPRRRELISQPMEIRPRQIQPRPPRDPYRFYHPGDKEQKRLERATRVEQQQQPYYDHDHTQKEQQPSLEERLEREQSEEQEEEDETQDMESTTTAEEERMCPQHEQEEHEQQEQQQPKSSLDFLSYAIAMTEGDQDTGGLSAVGSSSSQPQPDLSNIEPNEFDDERDGGNSSQTRTTLLRRPDWDGRTQKKPASAFHSVTNDDRFSGGETESDEPSPPSSPVAAAAHAIMMFVNDHYSRSSKDRVYHNNNNSHTDHH
ncbi:hypothetical protein BDB00DRAFT_797671 [Zychaea mexicana]|uniref:uncharacterized protein n=1 Tax=Zychaea mexicana TaxID=64656 RepID=UPI0022FE384A|nr:uncharacterized protein BDB00DRAFT_797671 [Zychaea mexicana]KAI9498991.1 hypothetical protein BDB00DRAFT_797671 [Zychaea mexicana]